MNILKAQRIGYNKAIKVVQNWINYYECAYKYSKDKTLCPKIQTWKEILEIIKAYKP